MCVETRYWVHRLIGLEWLLISGLTRQHNENSLGPKRWPVLFFYFYFLILKTHFSENHEGWRGLLGGGDWRRRIVSAVVESRKILAGSIGPDSNRTGASWVGWNSGLDGF